MEQHESIMERIIDFRNARDWEKFHTTENLAKSISIEAGELLELFQWGDPINHAEIKDELADILIYAFLLADSINVDPLKVMADKIHLNEQRFPVHKVKGKSGKLERVDINAEKSN